MNTVTIEIPEALNLKLVETAKQQGATAMQVVREALEDYLVRQERIVAPNSFAALAAEILDVPGDELGPTDLSSNKQHLNGYGQ